jgi:dolichol-phosphate mannosyltransferase
MTDLLPVSPHAILAAGPSAGGAGNLPSLPMNCIDRRSPNVMLSIVLPVFNEEHALLTLHERVTAAARSCGVRYEIIVVNDGSTDGGPRVLDALAAQDPKVRVIHLSRNFGHQAAVHAGLVHSTGDAVVLMDADLQDDPQAITRFLTAWRSGYDVVYALRTQRKEAAWKRFLFSAFHRLLSRAAVVEIPPHAGNFSLMDRTVVRHVVALAERDRYLPGLRSWVGFRQTGVPVERLARYDQRPRVSLRGLIKLAKTALFSFSQCPLAVFHAVGCVLLLAFVGVATYSACRALGTEAVAPDWASPLLTASFFGALNALGISILGEYLVRIYDQVRSRPIFVVQRRVNFDTLPADAASSIGSPGAATGEPLYDQTYRSAAELRDLARQAVDTSASQPVESPTTPILSR